MAESTCFNKRQRVWVREALETAESLAGSFFQLDLDDSERFPFDLETLAYLRGMEKTHRALAQVCKYEYGRKVQEEEKGKEFYRICLQDDKILKTVESELLKPLLLYVVTHELIHVIRFSLDPKRFHLLPHEKKGEEHDVHRMTYHFLKSLRDRKVHELLERYRPWWGGSRGKRSSGPLDNLVYHA
jgi:hypothetical protein